MTKPEDQVAKDKEAVAKMIGAKEAMSSAINRIKTLEEALVYARENCRRISKCFSEDVYLRVYERGDYKPIKLIDQFKDIDAKICGVI